MNKEQNKLLVDLLHDIVFSEYTGEEEEMAEVFDNILELEEELDMEYRFPLIIKDKEALEDYLDTELDNKDELYDEEESDWAELYNVVVSILKTYYYMTEDEIDNLIESLRSFANYTNMLCQNVNEEEIVFKMIDLSAEALETYLFGRKRNFKTQK